MEGRAHSAESYNTLGDNSRMNSDLRECSDNFVASFQARPPIRDAVPHTPHIAVVGAGLSGLRCADVLLARGFDVTLIEARDNIGGRFQFADFNGQSIDLGPSWVHGTENNPIATIAKQTNTNLTLINDLTSVYDPHGNLLPQEQVEAGFDVVWELISDAFRHSNEEGDKIPPTKSLKDYFVERLDGREDKELILLLAEMWGGFIGDPWDKQSLRWFWLEECLDGDNLFVPQTHRGILNHVARRALKYGKLQLSTPVKAIESTDNGVDIKTATSDSQHFDEVIVTIPLGCLKRSTITFSPPLPDDITLAVKNASYSSLEKTFISFPAPFWSSASSTPTFVHFLTPKYLPEGQEAWALELVTLSSESVSADATDALSTPATLLIDTYGPAAAHVVSLVRGLTPGSAEYLAALDSFFRPYYSLLPNFSSDDARCQPSAAHTTTWLDDEFGGHGSYTNFKVSDGTAEVVLDEGVRAVRRGLPDRRVWFAGEYTAPFVAMGTTTGAYWSGEAAGMRVAAAYGRVEEVAARAI